MRSLSGIITLVNNYEKITKSRLYMPNTWEIKKEEFPHRGSLIEKIKFVLSYAILAPSTHNSQPWLFKIGEDSVKIYYDKNLKLPEADPKGRDLYISMGCMLENLLIAASYFGIYKGIRIQLRDNFIGEIFFQNEERPNIEVGWLIDAIPVRINARGLFENRSLPENISGELARLNGDGRIKIDFVTDKRKINELSSLTAAGLRLAYKKPSFRKEMSRWMHNNLSAKKYGLPGYSLRMPFLLSFIIPTLVKFFDISPLLAMLNYRSMSSVPFVSVLSSDESNPEIWLAIGRLAERQMLYLNSQGIRTSVFVASIEINSLYKKVQEVLDSRLTPQFLFCAGYMKVIQKHSPRQTANEKILK